MQSGIVRAICQMGVFMICAQAVIHFRPKASYEKYLKTLVGAMILIQLLVALGGFFSKEGGQKMSEYMQGLADSLERSMQQASAEFSLREGLEDIMGAEPVQGGASQTESERSQAVGIGRQKIRVQVEPVSPIRIQIDDRKNGSTEQTGGTQTQEEQTQEEQTQEGQAQEEQMGEGKTGGKQTGGVLNLEENRGEDW